MKAKRVSVAEAKNRLPALIHEAESSRVPVEITRRGKTVAVLLSSASYERRGKARESVVDEIRRIFAKHGGPPGVTDDEVSSWRSDGLDAPRSFSFDDEAK